MLAVGAAMLRPVKVSATPERPMDLGTIGLTGAVGFATGVASGFFGIGGGFLIVPGLMLATGMSMIGAVGSSLLAVGCLGMAAAVNYAFSGLVDWVTLAAFHAGGGGGGWYRNRWK